MTLGAIAVTSLILGFSGAMMPGPLLTLTISEAARRGMRAGPLLIAGHALLEATLVILLLFGLAELVQRPPVFALIALIGGTMLIWMGYGMVRSLSGLSLDLSADEQEAVSPLVAGALVSLANPYFTLWWATVGIGYLTLTIESGWLGGVTFYFFHILADLLWYSFVAMAVSRGRTLLTDKVYRGLIASCALFLIMFGGYFGFCGIEKLLST